MVHEHKGRGVGLFGQRRIQPSKPLRAQLAATLARHQRVEADEAQWSTLDRVLEEACAGKYPSAANAARIASRSS